MTDLRTLSASRIAELIRRKEISSRDAVEAHIEQVERVNPVINAVVATRFAEARREADGADQLLRSAPEGRLPPFHGVPCTIKECFQLTGMPQTSGLVSRKNFIASADAPAVQRLRSAGAIPLGVTNVSELCMWIESTNKVYGRSNNPYDPSRIVGGSSGGEGAIVAAAASPFGLGSDIGGSIRGPAFFNGVFGHKPTPGIVPSSGQHPTSENAAWSYLTTGPLTRRAEDLMPLMRVMAGPDGVDPVCREASLGDPASVSLSGRTLLHVEDNGVLPVSDDLRGAQERAMRALERRGMRVRTAKPRALAMQFEIWSAMMSLASDTPFATLLGNGRPVRPGVELVKWAAGRSDHTIMAILTSITDPIPRRFPARARRMADLCRELRAEIDSLLGEDGIWLYPPYTKPAPRHGEPVREAVRLTMPFAYLGIMNVLGLPSTQVPLGLNARGLPLGVQVASLPHADHVTIAVALELEKEFGGWTPPSMARVGNGSN